MSYFILVLFLNVLFLVEFLSNIFWLWAKILWLRSLKAFPHFFLHSSHRYFFGFFLRCFSVSWIIRPTLVQLLKLHLIHLKCLPENKQKHVNKHLKKIIIKQPNNIPWENLLWCMKSAAFDTKTESQFWQRWDIFTLPLCRLIWWNESPTGSQLLNLQNSHSYNFFSVPSGKICLWLDKADSEWYT